MLGVCGVVTCGSTVRGAVRCTYLLGGFAKSLLPGRAVHRGFATTQVQAGTSPSEDFKHAIADAVCRALGLIISGATHTQVVGQLRRNQNRRIFRALACPA
jgi:hypothetical protein